MGDFSGKLVLRLPPELHERAAKIAEAQGVSLNLLLATWVADAAGRSEMAPGLARDVISTYGPNPPKPGTRRIPIE